MVFNRDHQILLNFVHQSATQRTLEQLGLQFFENRQLPSKGDEHQDMHTADEQPQNVWKELVDKFTVYDACPITDILIMSEGVDSVFQLNIKRKEKWCVSSW